MRIAREALSDVWGRWKTGWGGVVGGCWRWEMDIEGLAAWPALMNCQGCRQDRQFPCL